MKKRLSTLVCMILVLGMIISSINMGDVYAADASGDAGESQENYLKNPGFENDVWGSDAGWISNESWWSDRVKWGSASDQIKEGDHGLHFYTASAMEITVNQTVSLEAGTYTLSGYFSGALSTPVLYTDVSEDTAEVPLTGWGTWDCGKLTFTITEDQDVTLGFKLDCQDGGWGDVDCMSLVKGEGSYDEGDDDEPEAEAQTVTVEPVSDLSSDFAMGVDISSMISEEEAGVQYKNANGEVEDLLKILQDAGVNYIRVRIWNDPYDSEGNSYGGGNNDLETAKKIAERVAQYDGMKLCVDFHYSDFWASPTGQLVPKAWKGKSVSQKAKLISEFTTEALNELQTTGADIGMVQVGNETSKYFCGEKSWKSICTMMKAGCTAVKAVDPNIKTMIHFGGSASKAYVSYASYLKKYNVPYDILGISWYTFYKHGTLDTLISGMNQIATKYDKEVVIAENSYPYQFDDTDGHPETFGDDLYLNFKKQMEWEVSPQGQAEEVRDAIDALSQVKNNKGIGYFYWEPAWISVGDTTGLVDTEEDAAWTNQYNQNKEKWAEYGCGWATEYCKSYFKTGRNAASYWGGSSWDNQAMFDPSGKALDSLNVFKYVRTGSTGNQSKLTSFEEPSVSLKLSDKLDENAIWNAIWWSKVNCSYANGKTDWTEVRRWIDSECRTVIKAYKNKKMGTYTIHGIMKDDTNSVVTMSVKILGAAKCSLSKTTLTYTGKTQTPSVTVKTSSGKKLKKNRDYTVTYPEESKDVGRYVVTVKGTDSCKYSVDSELSFEIRPKGTSISKLTADEAGFTVTYKPQTSQTSGYEIAYSTSSKFAEDKTASVTYEDLEAVSQSITSLNSKTKYYVRIRTYTLVDGETYYSGWSSVKNIKTK